MNNLSVFFPAYNEAENIKQTLIDADSVLKSLKIKYEMIVVDDGSSDDTAKIVREMCKANPNLRLVSYKPNRGYGGALKVGFAEAKYDWVAFADSDGQFDFSEIKSLIEKSEKSEFVLGYRIKRADPLIRTLGTKFWTFGAILLLGLKVRDYSCGFKLIKKSAYQALLPLVGEEKVTQIEMLVKARRLGFNIAEVGVHHYPRQFGVQTGANIKVVLKSYLDLLKLWWKIR